MSALWPSSLVPFIDATGTPYAGALARFFDAGTSTPQTTYSESSLSISSPNPVVANANGMFPAVFMSPGTYRVRVTDSTGGTVLFDVDGISVAQDSDYVPPSAGSTDPTLLFTTGMMIGRHGTGVLTGWVRANGRTIGNAASGASERANADTSALFQFLWAQDSTLTISGGRGSTAAGDYAANKTIALPDDRSRGTIGLADMGNTDVALIADATWDNSENGRTLGATVGASTNTLTAAQIPPHAHPATSTTSESPHTHTFPAPTVLGASGGGENVSSFSTFGTGTTAGAVTGLTVATTVGNNTGGGGAHPNVQPSLARTIYIKL